MKKVVLAVLACNSPLFADSLAKQLSDRRAGFVERAAPELLASQAKALAKLSGSDIYERALKVGDQAPDFTVTDLEGESVQLSSLLKKGPVVVTWYRGGWCPYCNIALRSLAENAKPIGDSGATILALTPEAADYAEETVAETKLPFEVGIDNGLEVAKSYGIDFSLNEDTADRYNERFGLYDRNGEKTGKRLPLPATYVIGQDGKIAYAFVDADYTKRAEPSRIIDAVTALENGPSAEHLALQFYENVWNPPYDLSLIDELMAEEFTSTMGGQEISGRAAFKEWVGEVEALLPAIRFESEGAVVSQDGQSVVIRWSAKAERNDLSDSEPSEKKVDLTGITIWKFSDEKLVQSWSESSAPDILQTFEDADD